MSRHFTIDGVVVDVVVVVVGGVVGGTSAAPAAKLSGMDGQTSESECAPNDKTEIIGQTKGGDAHIHPISGSVRPSVHVRLHAAAVPKPIPFYGARAREREKIARLSELSLIGGGGGGADLSGIATQAADATDGDDGHRKRK